MSPSTAIEGGDLSSLAAAAERSDAFRLRISWTNSPTGFLQGAGWGAGMRWSAVYRLNHDGKASRSTCAAKLKASSVYAWPLPSCLVCCFPANCLLVG
jgi:hypothetical protein